MCERYGGPEVLELRNIDQPEVPGDGVLVRVRAAGLNPLDWHALTGTPFLARLAIGLRRPKSNRVGTDFAGTVEAVGSAVTRFRPGDDVFGLQDGALADYVVVAEEKAIVSKPANVSFEQAGGVGVAGVTALQGLRDRARLQSSRKVLVNGASGGVGTFAVQIAKALGAEVTGVCRTANVELVRSLGADRVVDYTRQDFTRTGDRYDVVFDCVGTGRWSDLKRSLADGGVLVLVGAPKQGRLLGGVGHALGIRIASVGSRADATMFLAKPNRDDLAVLAGMMESGQVVPVVDRLYDLGETAAAFEYLAQWHTRGKVVVTV
jgi:NADPH:quinone reductase-like Zn-dependent oxidoreductase